MDTILNPVSVTSQPYAVPAPKAPSATDTFSTATPQVAPFAPATSAPSDTETSANGKTSETYENALRQAALSFKNVYALGDQQFSIFKDASGKYITRYVSLRDGKVTYLPEPTLVKQIDPSATTATRVAISA